METAQCPGCSSSGPGMQGCEGGAMVMTVMAFDAWVGVGHTGPVGRG